MNADWVAASVRARGMAQRRLGAAPCRTIAAQPTLAAGLALLAETVYGVRLATVQSDATSPTMADVEHALRSTTLWQLRVLSGWLPVSGRRLARALAAEYEVDNILALAARLHPDAPDAPDASAEPTYLDLGALATAWPRARTAQTRQELDEVLRASRWGEVGPGWSSPRDILTLSRLGRLAAESLSARPWAQSAAGLLVSRVRFVDQSEPSPRFQQLARPLVGVRWLHASTLPEMRDALPHAARATLDRIDDPHDLWRAEARHHVTMESDALRLLRSALPGPAVILGGVTALAVDAWRVRVALAAAATGQGSSEVLDAVA